MKSIVSISQTEGVLVSPVLSLSEYKSRQQIIEETLSSSEKIEEFDALYERILLGGRSLENIAPASNQVICTTYFTSKNDPQREKIRIDTDNFEYIKEWYDSVVALNLHGVVFVDELTDTFIERYQNKNIQFIRCELGGLSLNDERYFIYFLYLYKYRSLLDSVLFTDGNDVILNKNPFELIGQFPSHDIFIGRNDTNQFKDSPFNIKKIRSMNFLGLYQIKSDFWIQPIYNAGILGGKQNISLTFLFYMSYHLLDKSSKDNMNMLVFNYVVYAYFCPKNVTSAIGKLLKNIHAKYYIYFYQVLKDLNIDYPKNKYVDHKNDQFASTEVIHTSYPLHNAFKSFEHSGQEYIFHK